MKERLAKLIDVKSIITIALTLALIITTLQGRETSDLFEAATMLVLGFFFGKKSSDKPEGQA